MERITSFSRHWYDCGCSYVYDVLHENIKIHRNRRLMEFIQYDGFENIVSSTQIKLDGKETESFFSVLEKVSSEWKTDYSVMVCDGFQWKMLLRHGSKKVTKIIGTVELPPQDNTICKYIRLFIENADSQIAPRMIGI